MFSFYGATVHRPLIHLIVSLCERTKRRIILMKRSPCLQRPTVCTYVHISRAIRALSVSPHNFRKSTRIPFVPLQRERTVFEWKKNASLRFPAAHSPILQVDFIPWDIINAASRKARLCKEGCVTLVTFFGLSSRRCSPSSRKKSHNTLDPLGYNV